MQALAILDFTVTSALGVGRAATLQGLREGRSGLAHQQPFEGVTLDTWTGVVPGVDDQRLPAALADFDCRNNRLAWLARVRDALLRHGRLLLRVGNLGNARRFATRQWVDRLVTLARGHRVAPTYGRAVTGWVALLCELGSTVRSVLMSQGTPVAKVLLVADL